MEGPRTLSAGSYKVLFKIGKAQNADYIQVMRIIQHAHVSGILSAEDKKALKCQIEEKQSLSEEFLATFFNPDQIEFIVKATSQGSFSNTTVQTTACCVRVVGDCHEDGIYCSKNPEHFICNSCFPSIVEFQGKSDDFCRLIDRCGLIHCPECDADALNKTADEGVTRFSPTATSAATFSDVEVVVKTDDATAVNYLAKRKLVNNIQRLLSLMGKKVEELRARLQAESVARSKAELQAKIKTLENEIERLTYRLFPAEKVKQCPTCKYGPILNEECSDLKSHDGQTMPGNRLPIDNKCKNCGFFASRWGQWAQWDGKLLSETGFAIAAVEQSDAVGGGGQPAEQQTGEISCSKENLADAGVEASDAADANQPPEQHTLSDSLMIDLDRDFSLIASQLSYGQESDLAQARRMLERALSFRIDAAGDERFEMERMRDDRILEIAFDMTTRMLSGRTNTREREAQTLLQNLQRICEDFGGHLDHRQWRHMRLHRDRHRIEYEREMAEQAVDMFEDLIVEHLRRISDAPQQMQREATDDFLRHLEALSDHLEHVVGRGGRPSLRRLDALRRELTSFREDILSQFADDSRQQPIDTSRVGPTESDTSLSVVRRHMQALRRICLHEEDEVEIEDELEFSNARSWSRLDEFIIESYGRGAEELSSAEIFLQARRLGCIKPGTALDLSPILDNDYQSLLYFHHAIGLGRWRELFVSSGKDHRAVLETLLSEEPEAKQGGAVWPTSEPDISPAPPVRGLAMPPPPQGSVGEEGAQSPIATSPRRIRAVEALVDIGLAFNDAVVEADIPPEAVRRLMETLPQMRLRREIVSDLTSLREFNLLFDIEAQVADTARPPNVHLQATIRAPAESPYGAGREFTLRIAVSSNYPRAPPVFRFDPIAIMHPHVDYETGATVPISSAEAAASPNLHDWLQRFQRWLVDFEPARFYAGFVSQLYANDPAAFLRMVAPTAPAGGGV